MTDQDRLAERLRGLAENLWWTWQPGVLAIFRDLDPALWRDSGHNPIAFLKVIDPDLLKQRASELALHSRIDNAFRRLHKYLRNDDSWGAVQATILRARPVAYFSMEFGLHESLPIYSGGLGVLAGDHLKSSSDLGIPLVGVGILWNQGYFHQSIDEQGWQVEHYSNSDPELLPITPALGPDGKPVRIAVESNAGTLHARVWKVAVGRTSLLLLDSDLPENSESDRALTGRLYGGNAEVRIRQELLLGVGGVRALRALEIAPSVIHLNEGHSAFAVLEMIHAEMGEQGVSFSDAAREVASMTVFTTHTPVAAGHDRFPAELVETHLGKLREALEVDYDQFMGLGRVHPEDHGEPFCMTVLALKLSRHANGVSALHGVVSRRMWHPLYPNRPEEQVPIGHITNGVHVLSWIAPQMRELYDRQLGSDWPSHQRHPETWKGIDRIEDSELWETQQVLKAGLIDFARHRLAMQVERRGGTPEAAAAARKALDPEILTIGFARRFATYKRANLVLRDAERLAGLVRSADRPIQLIFAGKAHPEDRFGKELIQNIVRLADDPRFTGRIAFIEDYDMDVARHLVQGVDVWLNNPRRPQEASGTSGEKVLLNGGLNCSILDGWWAEAYDGSNGFAIGRGQTHSSVGVQDDRDQEALLRTLRDEVVPLYYDRDVEGLPLGWIARQKAAMRSLGWRFNADRMVVDYALTSYLPAANGLSCQMP